jgi:hypothetical protein
VRIQAVFRSTMLGLFWSVILISDTRAQDTPLARGTKHFDKGEYAEAAAAFEKGVAAGDAACMDFLGFLYLEGYGNTPRPWIAYGYFREAARLGNDQACRNLGNMYFDGRGVEPDLVQAAAWWEKSIARGKDPRPAFSLGQLHWLGDGLPRRFWKFAESKTATLVKDVPFVHQAYNFCGVASSTMMLRHQGLKVSQYDVARARTPNQWGEGSHWDELVSVAGKLERKWRIDSFANTEEGFATAKAALIKELRAGRPIVIDILENKSADSAHSIVVCGYDPQTAEFLVRNPALPFPGFQVFTEERLKVIWRSRGFIPKNSKLLRPMMLADTGGQR